MHAVTKQATLPAIMALTATLATTDFLDGIMVAKAPIWTPIEHKFENPHRAYVVMITDRS